RPNPRRPVERRPPSRHGAARPAVRRREVYFRRAGATLPTVVRRIGRYRLVGTESGYVRCPRADLPCPRPPAGGGEMSTLTSPPIFPRPPADSAPAARPVRVCFLIDELAVAGTETQLLALIRHVDR